ncbi:FprA family A-type flavoprotein [Anaerolentibacter hominis]|uniref:FprA family A-type flavoprotein n=1 Tax=Anaerolentibacter hominis TaxID=3079009 RepID=UPI0031B812F7
MHCTREIAPSVHWVGASDRRLALFENMFPIPDGVSYHSYLILDDKTALIDTVDSSVTRQFLENVEWVLDGRPLDYLVINHMEPDHCANIEELCFRYPDMKIVGNTKTFQMIRQFYHFDTDNRTLEVKEKEELILGRHLLRFYMTPMVHWPEVMMTYEISEKILFSADAFGSFSASPNLFADEVDFETDYLSEARRYYTNIVGKYGAQVQAALKKLSAETISMICPLHGFIWRQNLGCILEKYQHWSNYEPEAPGVVLVYASMYGNTENAVNVLASRLAGLGVRNLNVYDVSKTHPSYIIASAFRFSHLVFACPTYNNGLYFAMESFLTELLSLNLQNRKVALIGNGSWAPTAGKVMKALLEEPGRFELLNNAFEIRSSLRQDQLAELDSLADIIHKTM